jgi:hypothetical protein
LSQCSFEINNALLTLAVADLTNDAWSTVTEGRVGGPGDRGDGLNNTFIPCQMGKLPPAGVA